jgi:hypothetical protein
MQKGMHPEDHAPTVVSNTPKANFESHLIAHITQGQETLMLSRNRRSDFTLLWCSLHNEARTK